MKRLGVLAGFFVLGFVAVRYYKKWRNKKRAGKMGRKFGQLGREIAEKKKRGEV